MVFVKFVTQLVFVGESLEAVMHDTIGGTRYGCHWLEPNWQEITEEEARKLNPGLLNLGIAAVQDQGCKSMLVTYAPGPQ
jgi:hypothetical protein